MKLEDLKRYTIEDRYSGDHVFSVLEPHADGHVCEFADVQAFDAAHKQREAELLALLNEIKAFILFGCGVPVVHSGTNGRSLNAKIPSRIIGQIDDAMKDRS